MSLAYDTTERRLDMTAGAPEPVVEIEMAERGVKVVPPEKVDDTLAEPHALRMAGRTVERARGLRKVVKPTLLRVLGRFAGWRLGPLPGLRVALGEGRTGQEYGRGT
jgi:hypothetical protein